MSLEAGITWKGLRRRGLQVINASVSDDTYNDWLRERCLEALDMFILDVPDGLLTGSYQMYIPRQVQSATEGFYFSTTSDPWVLELVQLDGDPFGSSGSSTTGWFPTITGAWDGLMWIEVTTANGIVWSCQTREWFRTGDGGLGGPFRYYVSLCARYPEYGTPDTDMVGRIWPRYMWFPSQVLRPIGDPRIHRSGGTLVKRMDHMELLRVHGESWKGTENGTTPLRMSKATVRPFPASSYVPQVSASGSAWAGPVQEGDFTFRFTLAWGKHDAHQFVGLNTALSWPLFESAPSAESATFSHTTNPGVGVIVTLPNIDFMENFYDAGTIRHLHSGLYLLVYVSRSAVRSAGLGAINQVETDDGYYLLDAVEVASAGPSYTWTGVAIPDRSRRLRYQSGTAEGWLVQPIQTQDIQLNWNCAYLPDFVERDYDVIPIRPQYAAAFQELFLAMVCMADGRDIAASEKHMQRYLNAKGKMTAQNDAGSPYFTASSVSGDSSTTNYVSPYLRPPDP